MKKIYQNSKTLYSVEVTEYPLAAVKGCDVLKKFELRFFDGSFTLSKIFLVGELSYPDEKRVKIKILENSTIISKVLSGIKLTTGALFDGKTLISAGNAYLVDDAIIIVTNNNFDLSPFFSPVIELIEL
ncbi:hypothetical protein [Fusobacterium ulcerans]|uniref:hypothetical protein n=1 Tax=Fusobacterium ulcerans TaxID=861 RepID=UPI001D0B80F8|nr:hypothetical protein [Fusobacterium ulcerans]MCB8563719.1 hypothetical protein [Fusobacterium ulcerans]MCB8649686.1 hypothetical protein [Fusobacterium ulcerans]